MPTFRHETTRRPTYMQPRETRRDCSLHGRLQCADVLWKKERERERERERESVCVRVFVHACV